MQTIGSLGQSLSLDADRIGKCNGGIFVGACPPHISVGHHPAPYFAFVNQWAVIANGDVGDSDALCHHSALAGTGQIQNDGLSVSHGNKKQQSLDCC